MGSENEIDVAEKNGQKFADQLSLALAEMREKINEITERT